MATIEQTSTTLENVTIYRNGFFGPVRTDCRIVEIESGVKWAQYERATRVKLIQKGKRKQYGFMIAGSAEKCLIVSTKDAVDIRDWMQDQPDGSRASRFASCDPEYFAELERDLTSKGVTVLFSYGV